MFGSPGSRGQAVSVEEAREARRQHQAAAALLRQAASLPTMQRLRLWQCSGTAGELLELLGPLAAALQVPLLLLELHGLLLTMDVPLRAGAAAGVGLGGGPAAADGSDERLCRLLLACTRCLVLDGGRSIEQLLEGMTRAARAAAAPAATRQAVAARSAVASPALPPAPSPGCSGVAIGVEADAEAAAVAGSCPLALLRLVLKRQARLEPRLLQQLCSVLPQLQQASVVGCCGVGLHAAARLASAAGRPQLRVHWAKDA